MRLVTAAFLLGSMVLSLAPTGCAGTDGTDTSEPDPDAAAMSADELRVGQATTAHPEVGRLDITLMGHRACTGTLVRDWASGGDPRRAGHAVLTSGECVDYRTSPIGGILFGHFYLQPRAGGKELPLAIDGIRTFGDVRGYDDLALLHLRDAVPASVATPATLALEGGEDAADGEVVAMYGFGRDAGPSTTKKVFRFVWGDKETQALATGHGGTSPDSGGPSFVRHLLFRVANGTNPGLTSGKDDIFVHLTGLSSDTRSRLVSTLRAWD